MLISMDFWIKFIWGSVSHRGPHAARGRQVPTCSYNHTLVIHGPTTTAIITLVTKYRNFYLCTATQLVFSILCRPELRAWTGPLGGSSSSAHTPQARRLHLTPLSSCSSIGGQIGNVFSEAARPLGCLRAVRTGNLGKEFKSSFSNLGQVYEEYSQRRSGDVPEAQDWAASELDSAPLLPALPHFHAQSWASYLILHRSSCSCSGQRVSEKH